MIKKVYFWFLMGFLGIVSAKAQSPVMGANVGEYRFPSTQCITIQQSENIKTTIRQQQAVLRQQGILPAENDPSQRTQSTSFTWPLRLAAGLTDPGYYAISNYVDEDPSYPNLLEDYNCGTRSYDQSNGYNHAGTDIFTWPYGQLKQQNNEVEIIAAAPGVIINRNDGSPDHNCDFCTSYCLWNAVYIQHADGSVAWYGHMKNGSVTAKGIGQTVARGEKLGVVGSSGNSTRPHLHFEVYANASQTQLVDPWQGTCNNPGGALYNTGLKWEVQKPYRESMINRIQVGKQPPSWGDCPAIEAPNIATYFMPGDTIYMAAFYHDQVAGAPSIYTILQPDGTIWMQWPHSSPNTFNASYWYWYNMLPYNAISGTWTFQVQYSNGPVVATNFSVGATILPISLKNFSATASGPHQALLQWATTTESNNKGFHVQRSTDGITFQNVGWVNSNTNTVLQKDYRFTDDIRASGVDIKKWYYRLQQEDVDGKTTLSKTVAVQWVASGSAVIVFPNPVKDALTIQGEGLQKATIIDATGRIVAQVVLQGYSTIYPVTKLPSGKYMLQILHTNGKIMVNQFIKN